MSPRLNTQSTNGGSDGFRSRVNRAIFGLKKRGWNGTGAFLAGGVLLVRALKSPRTTSWGTPLALGSVVLLGVGLRQRLTEHQGTGPGIEAEIPRTVDGEKRVSDEAYAESHGELGAHRNADESQSVYQSETEPNPRGMTDRADIQKDDGGDIDFVVGKEPETHRETHLEDEGAHDPRLHPDNDDQQTEIDLSTAAMADEASEAAGPHPEQSYPTREGTDPEPTSENAPERTGQGAVASAGVETGDDFPGANEGDEEDEPRESPE